MFHLVVAAWIAAISSTQVGGGSRLAPDLTDPAAAVVVTSSPAIQESLRRLWEGSASWRASIDHLREQGRRAVIFTPDQVAVQVAGRVRRFDADLLAEVAPVVEADGRVREVIVVINLPLIEASHAARTRTLSELHADLDRIVAHELYGHAVPYLIAGDVSGHCADPVAGQRPADACAISRENVIRAELGLGRRTDAGLYGLALARPSRH